MKKIVTFVLVALVALGCVFAADSAVLGITANIGAVQPTFRLKATGTAITAETIANVGASTPSTVALTTTAANGLAESTDATVNFTIQQKSDAKMFGTYTFTVTSTDLVAKQGTRSDDEWNKIDSANKKFVVDSTTPSVTAHANYTSNSIGFATLNATGNKLTVTYIGVLKATEANPVDLGTFSCTWTHNDKAITADYEATITLTVSGS